MAASNVEAERASSSTSMFTQKDKNQRDSNAGDSEENTKPEKPAEIITVKDFFDFMKTAYQVYEHNLDDEEECSKINWEELTKLTVLNHVIEQGERDLLFQTLYHEQKPIISKSDTALEKQNKELDRREKRSSCSELEGR